MFCTTAMIALTALTSSAQVVAKSPTAMQSPVAGAPDASTLPKAPHSASKRMDGAGGVSKSRLQTMRQAASSSVPGVSFLPAVSYFSGAYEAISIAVADVNGDGKPDLVVANLCTGNVECATGQVGVLLGNGDGTFQPVAIYSSGGQYAVAVAVADVNGDGKPDVVVGNEFFTHSSNSTGGVGVLLGNGDGTFQPAVTYHTGAGASLSVAVADLNGDGKPDLVTTTFGPGSVGVLLGNGDGTFQTVVTYHAGAPVAVAVADVNGDGKPDVLVVDDPGAGVLLGNGDGTLQPEATYTSGGVTPTSIAHGDLNGDGKPDLVVMNFDSGNVGVLFGNGDGTFQPPVNYSGADSLGSPSVAIADVNGDGKQDLLVVAVIDRAGDGGIGILLGNGDGTFQPESVYASGGWDTQALVVADVNGDGKLDIVTANLQLNTQKPLKGIAGVLLNNGNHPASTTTLTTSFHPSTYGQPITLTAKVVPTAGGLTPTGTVTFNDGAALLGTGTLSEGVATLPNIVFPAGGHSLTATYSGDSLYLTSTSTAVFQNVLQAASTTSLASSLNPSSVGQAVTFTAAIAGQFGGTASGTVEFKQGTVVLATVPITGNMATVTYAFPRAGAFTVSALYSGDSNLKAGTWKSISQVVNQGATKTTLGSSLNPSTYKQLVTFTATVTSVPPGTITGLVSFMDGSSLMGKVALASGKASFTTGALTGGPHSITATYTGSTNYLSSTSAVITQRVNRAITTTTLAATPNPSSFGQTVRLTATVKSGTLPATGAVTFKRAGTTIGTSTLSANGVAVLNLTTLPVGTDALTVVYATNTNFRGSTSAVVNEVVNKAKTTTTLQSSLNPAPHGTAVTFTATIKPQFSGSPSGMVTFKDGTTTLVTVTLSAGTATFRTSTLAVGAHRITATYNGDMNFITSSGALTETVN